LRAWKCLCGALEGLGVLLGCSGGLVAAKFVKCPKSYYTEQFEKYRYIRDKYNTTYNTPTPYDPSLQCIVSHLVYVEPCAYDGVYAFTLRSCELLR